MVCVSMKCVMVLVHQGFFQGIADMLDVDIPN